MGTSLLPQPRKPRPRSRRTRSRQAPCWQRLVASNSVSTSHIPAAGGIGRSAAPASSGQLFQRTCRHWDAVNYIVQSGSGPVFWPGFCLNCRSLRGTRMPNANPEPQPLQHSRAADDDRRTSRFLYGNSGFAGGRPAAVCNARALAVRRQVSGVAPECGGRGRRNCART